MALPLLAAGVDLGVNALQAFLNWKSQQEAQDLNEQNMRFQQGVYKDQQKQALATKTDPYGNKLVYTPGIGWHYELTDQTRGLLGAEQAERTKQLTEDTARNRRTAERDELLAKQGFEDYGRARADKLYGDRYSEGSVIDDVTRALMLNRYKGLNEGKNVLARQALRMESNPSLLPQIMKQADDLFGSSLEDLILKGRMAGSQEYRARQGFRDDEVNSDLDRYFKQASAGPTSSVGSSGFGTSLQSLFDNASSGLADATGNTSGISSAYSRLAGGVPTLDLSGLAGSASKFLNQFGGSSTPTSGVAQKYGLGYSDERPLK